MRESDVARRLCRRVKEVGGLVYKVRFEGRSDCPDYVVIHAGRVQFVETKRPGAKPRESQRYQFGIMAEHGCKVVVVSTVGEVEQFIDEIL